MLFKKIKAWGFLFVFVAIVLCHISIGVAQSEDKPNPKVDYVARLNEIGKAGRTESLNAASYYEKAFRLLVEQPGQIS